MARPAAHQNNILRDALNILRKATRTTKLDSEELRFQILEAAAARVGGFNIDWYWKKNRIKCAHQNLVHETAEQLVSEISSLNIHPSICLAILSTPELAQAEKRKSGAYYTDFRLAHYLSGNFEVGKLRKSTIIDPACGSGILLVAVALRIAVYDRKKLAKAIKSQIFGVDKNPLAIRAATLSLASLTANQESIISLMQHLIALDSLLEIDQIRERFAPKGFGAVITNPPWEKIKITRHEYLSHKGVKRHYGDIYKHSAHHGDYEKELRSAKQYGMALLNKYQYVDGQDIDLYPAFLELCLKSITDQGQVGILIPAGFIRSQGTVRLREYFFSSCAASKISVFENKARFFSIDTRFKFLAVYGQKVIARNNGIINFSHPQHDAYSILDEHPIRLTIASLMRVRPDLSIPEVRSHAEWLLFQRMAKMHPPLMQWGQRLGMRFKREIDMTKDRPLFGGHPSNNRIPLIEGRMVHQYTCKAKAYSSGTGRRAKWVSVIGKNDLKPQFWVTPQRLPSATVERMRHTRIGFCDITGQTNERSMMAAIIPKNVICGNKVPTILFEKESENTALQLAFIAILNSFVFDWMLRRTLTTTVNYFILEQVPFPRLEPRSPLVTRLAQLVGQLPIQAAPFYTWEEAHIRAEIEALIVRAYNITSKDLRLVLDDFPLLDRSEPPLPGERRSTITRDFLIAECTTYMHWPSDKIIDAKDRLQRAQRIGAVPFRPSHLLKDDREEIEKANTTI